MDTESLKAARKKLDADMEIIRKNSGWIRRVREMVNAEKLKIRREK